jgi:hypothetical protein
MTDSERAALNHIRQVVDSVIGVPAPPEPLPAGTYASILPVPYVSKPEEIEDMPSDDSGALAGVMLVQAYTDNAVTPNDFCHQAGQSDDNPLSFTQILNALSVNGIPVELRSNLKLADLSLILFSGRPVIAPIKLAVLQQAGLTLETFNGTYYVVVVGMDVKQVFIHMPVRKDSSGQAQDVPWQVYYQAWSQALGYERAVLVPRQQLIRRVRVNTRLLDIHEQPEGSSKLLGKLSLGELFEVTRQKNGWGKIGQDRWINLSSTADV